MRASPVISLARVLTWRRVILIAVLSLWPGRGIGFLYILPNFNSMRTGLPGRLEHFIAYAGSAAAVMAGFRARLGGGGGVRCLLVWARVPTDFPQFFSCPRPPPSGFLAPAAFLCSPG